MSEGGMIYRPAILRTASCMDKAVITYWEH